jgi:predicted nucleic acid-binding Zn ribbon protein
LGEQEWLGIAASLGKTAISTLLNPINLLGRLDDIAQDISNLKLSEKVWQVINNVAKSVNSGQELSERFNRVSCQYCGSANPPGEPTCISCGAPLGKEQPKSCGNCGFIINPGERFCPNCGINI